MADPPPGRLPPSAFTPFSAAVRVHGSEINPDPLRSQVRRLVSEVEVAPTDALKDSDYSLSVGAGPDEDDEGGSCGDVRRKERGVGSDSEMVSGGGSEDPDNSTSEEAGSDDDQGDTSCEDVDSVDTEEELRRDLEEQRIADEKNGHFSDDRLPAEGRVLCSETTAASHVARVFYEVASSSCWARDSSAEARRSSCPTGDDPPLITETTAAFPTATLVMQHGRSAGDVVASDVVGLEKVTMMGVGTHWGGSMLESTMKDVHDFDGSKVADFVMPISMMRESAFNACADSPPTCHPPLTHQPTLVHDANSCGGRDGEFNSKDVEMVDDLAASRKSKLLSTWEENQQLDLMESRPLAVQQAAATSPYELPLLGSTHEATIQVLSPTGPFLFPHHLKNSQPNAPSDSPHAKPNHLQDAAPNYHLPKSPSSLKFKPLAQAKNKSQTQPKPTLPTASAHFKIKSQPKSSLHSKQIAAALFSCSKKNDPPNEIP